MFRRQDVTVDSHSPPLIPPDLYVTVHAINQRGKLGAEKEDVDTAEGRDLVEGFCDGLFQGTDIEVGNHVPIDVDDGAALVVQRISPSEKCL